MTLLTVSPSASNHDAWQSNTGANTLTGEVRVTAGTAWAGLLLPGVTVPAGATISSATLYYKSSVGTHDDPDIDWYAEAADNAAVFAGTNSDISGRARTTAVTQDTATGIGVTTYRTVDITAQVAEVVGRGGWASGNNIALIGDGRGSSTDLWLRSWDSGGDVWYVEIVYTSIVNVTETLSLARGAAAAATAIAGAASSLALARGETAAPGGPAASAPTLTLARGDSIGLALSLAALESVLVAAARGMTVADALASGGATLTISAGGDDGVEITGGSMLLYTNAIDTDDVGDISGFLFRGLDAPKDASIVSAYLNVYPPDAGRQSPNVTIRAQGNPANFTASTNNFSSRTMTTASASWVASNIGTGAYKASPSLNSVIQEVVNDAGWTAGGNVALFLIQNSSEGWLRVGAYEYYPTALPAQLVVTWSSGGQQVTEALTLARGLGDSLTPAAAVALAVALARAEGVTAGSTAAAAAALALGRGLGLTNGDAAAVLQALALGRALGMDAPAAANAAALLALTRAAAVDATGAAAAGGALTLGRGEDVVIGPAAGIAAALTLGRLAGIGAVDGFTILEGIVLTRALGVATGERYDATAPLLLAVLRGLTATGAAGASAGVTLASGREVSIGHVLAGGEAVALARGLGVGVASGMALWETIALAAGRGVAVADALGYAVTLALGRGAGVGAAEVLAAGEALTLALGSGAAVAAAVGAVASVGLGRALGDDWSAGAALLESIGIGIFRAVGVDEAVNFILVTPRHVFVVDAEGRVRVIDLEERHYQVE